MTVIFTNLQFTIHIPGIHKDRDDIEIETGDNRIETRQVEVVGQFTNKPIASQHTNDVAHADHSRGENHIFNNPFH